MHANEYATESKDSSSLPYCSRYATREKTLASPHLEVIHLSVIYNCEFSPGEGQSK